MAASAATHAFGTVLKRGDGGSPEAFTTLSEGKTVNGPNMKKGSVDVTHNESPNNAMEFLPNLLDGGEISWDGNFIPSSTTHTNLLADIATMVNRNYRVVYPNATTSRFDFAGHPTAVNPTASHVDAMRLSATFKVSGKPVFTV